MSSVPDGWLSLLFDFTILPMNMPVAMKLRAVFIQQIVEAFESAVRQVLHVAVAAARRVGQQYVEIGFLFHGFRYLRRSDEVFIDPASLRFLIRRSALLTRASISRSVYISEASSL